MAYADITDLPLYGVPQTALQSIPDALLTAQLQSASDYADSFFRARWGTASVPLVAWDTAVREAVAKIAAYRLIRVRGFRPGSGSDSEIRKGHDDAVAWLDRVQRQQAHPLVTLAAVHQPGTPQPNFTSTSVVDLSNGRAAPNRGW